MANSGDAISESGLVYEDLVPLCWHQLPRHPDTIQLRSTHQSNEQVLRYLTTIDESRPESSDEDHGPLSHEIARLEFKIDLLIDMTGRLLARHVSVPDVVPLRMSAAGLQWQSGSAPEIGSPLSVEVYLNRRFPNPIVLHGQTDSVVPVDGGFRIEMGYRGVTEPVRNWLEKLIFRQHRRQVAHSRGAARGRDM